MIRCGLIGRSILASRSPWLHEEEARAQGLDLSYTLFDFTDRDLDDADLGSVLSDLRDQDYAGVNVTYPFKQAVIPLIDELADSARAVGAVNTVAMQGGRLIGHNTDMTGFRDSMRAGLPDAALARVLQLGAGGAGAAVASALLALGVEELCILDTDGVRATTLVERLSSQFPGAAVRFQDTNCVDPSDADGIVNATPVGMASVPGLPLSTDLLEPRHWVADIIYFPLETAFLRAARSKGCATLDGSGMVVRQAAKAFEIFTGGAADVVRMSSTFAGQRD